MERTADGYPPTLTLSFKYKRCKLTRTCLFLSKVGSYPAAIRRDLAFEELKWKRDRLRWIVDAMIQEFDGNGATISTRTTRVLRNGENNGGRVGSPRKVAFTWSLDDKRRK